MKLLDLHSLLQNSILTQEPLIEPHLCMPPKGSIADRVAIYTKGYSLRLIEALENDFGTLAALLGEKAFNQLGEDYINAYPSSSYTLDLLGLHLSQFLREDSSYSKKPYWAEIASFEWAEAQAITAKNAKKLLSEELQSIPVDLWPDLQFSFHPSCHLLEMHWNSLALMEAARDEKKIPAPKKIRPYFSFIWRHQLEVRYYKPNDLELTVLEAIKSQCSFMAICERLCQKMPEEKVASFLVQELQAWINEEVLVLV